MFNGFGEDRNVTDGRTDVRTDVRTDRLIIIQQSHETRSIISPCLAEQFYAAQHSHPHLYILLPAAVQL